MRRTKHTKEPWDAYLQADGTAWIIATKERDERGIRKMTIARIPLGSDAVDDVDRIVACVNACAGLDLPDDVETGALATLVLVLRHYDAEEVFVGHAGARVRKALAKLEGK